MNENELSENEKLDEVLNYFKWLNNGNQPIYNYNQVIGDLVSKTKIKRINVIDLVTIMKKLYRDNNLDFLSEVNGCDQYVISSDGKLFIGYVETQLKKAKQDKEELIKSQLDFKSKHRQVKWFYPTLMITGISVFVAIFSAWNNYAKTENQKGKIEYLEDELKLIKQSISTLHQNKMEDSMHISTKQTQTLTAK